MKGRRTRGDFEGSETPINSLRRGALLALVLAFVVFTLHEVFGGNGWLALRQQRRHIQALQQRVEAQRRQADQLQQEIQGLKSDPGTIERYAREQMHFARPGEIIYTFSPKPATSTPSTAAKSTTPRR